MTLNIQLTNLLGPPLLFKAKYRKPSNFGKDFSFSASTTNQPSQLCLWCNWGCLKNPSMLLDKWKVCLSFANEGRLMFRGEVGTHLGIRVLKTLIILLAVSSLDTGTERVAEYRWKQLEWTDSEHCTTGRLSHQVREKEPVKKQP